jgi:hypothetical protein
VKGKLGMVADPAGISIALSGRAHVGAAAISVFGGLHGGAHRRQAPFCRAAARPRRSFEDAGAGGWRRMAGGAGELYRAQRLAARRVKRSHSPRHFLLRAIFAAETSWHSGGRRRKSVSWEEW